MTETFTVQRLGTHPRPEKRRDYYRETVRFIVPLAERHPWFRDWFDAWRAEFGHLDGTAAVRGTPGRLEAAPASPLRRHRRGVTASRSRRATC
ncbi:hypothetical protein BCD48_33170 [Pseudofrankia sp. BMG5.36]|nr:hypothetical protein BCD48_33170 [Pseudofrankia sp. BMG5.36]